MAAKRIVAPIQPATVPPHVFGREVILRPLPDPVARWAERESLISILNTWPGISRQATR